jgi:hypothetical protein
MRLWTLHPRYLDAKGLVALWREGLLAQKVLRGRTRGYRSHPQLIRFQRNARPTVAISFYLHTVLEEARHRGYQFDGKKIRKPRGRMKIVETEGQMMYEWKHLKRKLSVRDTRQYRFLLSIEKPESHPLFRIIPGPHRDWERVK